MSQRIPAEVLEQFNEHFECWNRGELELMLSMYAEDAVFDFSAVFTDVGAVQGHENLRRYWMELAETWEGVGLEPIDGFDVGDGRFILEMRMSGVGKRSGAGVYQ